MKKPILVLETSKSPRWKRNHTTDLWKLMKFNLIDKLQDLNNDKCKKLQNGIIDIFWMQLKIKGQKGAQ